MASESSKPSWIFKPKQCHHFPCFLRPLLIQQKRNSSVLPKSSFTCKSVKSYDGSNIVSVPRYDRKAMFCNGCFPLRLRGTWQRRLPGSLNVVHSLLVWHQVLNSKLQICILTSQQRQNCILPALFKKKQIKLMWTRKTWKAYSPYWVWFCWRFPFICHFFLYFLTFISNMQTAKVKIKEKS